MNERYLLKPITGTWNLKNITKLSFFLCAVILVVSCGPSPEYLRSLHKDYFTTGFLSSDLYQAVITGSPDENVKGLVARRESARMNAISDLENRVLHKLYNEWKRHHGNDLKNIPEKKYREAVTTGLSTFVEKGRIV